MFTSLTSSRRLHHFQMYLGMLFLSLMGWSLSGHGSFFLTPQAFAATNITISGTIWNEDPMEFPCASDHAVTVVVKVNGAGSYSGTCTLDTGVYSISGVSVNPSDVITIFVDDASLHASYITKAAASPSNLTIDLNQNYVEVSHEDAGPITNAHLDQYDHDQNANIDFTVTSNNVALLNYSNLHVHTGATYSPGGTLNNNVLYVDADATVNIDHSGSVLFSIQIIDGTIHLNGDTTLTGSGIFNSGGTVDYTSGTPTLTCSASTASFIGSHTFYNLVLTNGAKYFYTGLVQVDHDWTIQAGVDVTYDTDLLVSGQFITVGSATVRYTGTPTATFNGTSIGGGSGEITLYNLTKSSSGTTTWSGTTKASVSQTLTVSAGTLQVNATYLILGSTINTVGGAFTASGSVIYATLSNTTISSSGSYTDLTLSDGMLGYWKLDETVGTTAADSSGFGHSGAHTANPIISSDVPTSQFANDRSLDFDGGTQYVDLGSPSYLTDQFNGQITLSAWIKPDVSKNALIVGKSANAAHSSPYYNYSLYQFGNLLNFRIGTTNINSSGSGTGALIVNGTTWQHVVGTYDGTTLRAYINGVEVASTVAAGLSIPTSDRHLRIGARDTTSMDEFFNGKIDDVRIYRRAITPQEIQSLTSGFQSSSSGATFTLGGNLDVNGDLTLASGTLDADNGQNYSLNIAGSFRNYGVMQPRNGTVTFDGTSSGKVIESGQQHFNNLTIAGSGGGWTLRDRLWVNGTLGISNGTLDVSTANYTVHAGTINQTGGTITPRSGTMVLDSSTNQNFAATSSLNVVRREDPTVSNLAGYWKFDEGSGVTANDRSGNGRDGTLTNAPTPTTALNSTTTYDNVAALDFDGSDDYVSMGNVINVADTDDLTISAWFNRDTSSTDNVIVAKRNGNAGSDVGYLLWIDAATDKVRFEASDGTNEYELASNATFTTTGWHHIVATWDENLVAGTKLYIDGALDSATATGTIGNVGSLSNAGSLRIGVESDAGAAFDGKIDDVRIYTVPLTATQAADLGAGRNANGDQGVATVTLTGAPTIATMALDSGTMSSGAATPTITNSLTLLDGQGSYVGGSNTQTLNGGLTVSGSAFTGGAGTIDINGSVTLSGGTVVTGAGNWSVSGSFTHSGSSFTASAGHTLTMDGTGTLTSNGQTLHNLSLVSSGTVTLAAATHTVAGNLVIGGSGTPSVTGSTISMVGVASTIDGGGKTLSNLTIDPTSSGTVTLQNSDLIVASQLSVASNDTLSLDASRTLTLSGNTGTTLTLTGNITGNGRLTYNNSATTFPTSGTLSSTLRFNMVNGDMAMPNRSYGSVEAYNGTSSLRTLTPASGSPTITGNVIVSADGSANAKINGTANNPTPTITGSISFAGVGAGTEIISTGTGNWNVGGSITLTNGTLTADSGNTITMTGSGTNLTTAGQALYNLTIASSGGVTLQDDQTLAHTLNVATSGALTLGGSATLTLNSPVTLQGTITGSGTLWLHSGATIGSTGTIGSNVTFDATYGNVTVPTRAFIGSTRTITLVNEAALFTIGDAAGTIAIDGNLLIDDGGAEATFNATTNNPDVSIGGDFGLSPSSNSDLYLGSGTYTVGGNVDVADSLAFGGNAATLIMTGAGKTLAMNDQPFGSVTIQGSVTSTGLMGVSQTFSIANGASFTASNALSIFSGDFLNSGTFNGSTGSVIFDAPSTGHTIMCGSGSFHDVTFNNAAGGWTLQSSDCVVGGSLTLNAGAAFTMQSGRSLTVTGDFTNSIGGAATTWSGSTLVLLGTGVESINTKTVTENYGAVHVGGTRQVQMWNSSYASMQVDAGAGLMSYDDSQTDGRLFISGAVTIPNNEAWSYTTDFDGVALGLARTANVALAAGSVATLPVGRALTISGEQFSTHRTVIDRSGASGTYALNIAGTLSAEYFEFHHLDGQGLNVASTGLVSQLEYGIFDDGSSGGSYITLSSPTSTLVTTEVIFDSISNGVDTATPRAISASGAGVQWIMNGAAGERIGPAATQAISGATISWNIPTMVVADGLTTDQDTTTDTDQFDLSWVPSNTTYVSNFMVQLGTTAGGSNTYSATNVGPILSTTVSPLSLTNGQTYYATVQALNSLGEKLFSATSDGILVDGASPDILNLVVSADQTSATVNWSTDEAATSLVEYGLTADLGTTALSSGSLTTSHTGTISGLQAGTTYYARVQSADAVGNTALSEIVPFTTTSVTSSVGIATPKLYTPVYRRSGNTTTIMVTGIARNSVAIRLYVDNKLYTTFLLSSTSEVTSFAIPLTTKNLTNGKHKYFVRAVNSLGEVSKSSRTITITVSGSSAVRRSVLSVATTYVVQRGDSLWTIAQRYFGGGAYYRSLITNNSSSHRSLLQSTKLFIGWVLRIPGG